MRVPDDEIDLEAEEGSSDSGYGGDEWGWHEYDNLGEVGSYIETTDSGCNDPRKYWIETVRARMHSVVEEWRHIVCTLKTTQQNVRPQCVVSLTNINTRPGYRSEAPSRISSPSPRTLGTDLRFLVLIE
jgi:hypothetical protein